MTEVVAWLKQAFSKKHGRDVEVKVVFVKANDTARRSKLEERISISSRCWRDEQAGFFDGYFGSDAEVTSDEDSPGDEYLSDVSRVGNPVNETMCVS